MYDSNEICLNYECITSLHEMPTLFLALFVLDTEMALPPRGSRYIWKREAADMLIAVVYGKTKRRFLNLFLLCMKEEKC